MKYGLSDILFGIEFTQRSGAPSRALLTIAIAVCWAIGLGTMPSAYAADPPTAEIKVVAASATITTQRPWILSLTVPGDPANKKPPVTFPVQAVGIPAIPKADININREITRYSQFKALAIAACINENQDAQKNGVKATVENTTGPITRADKTKVTLPLSKVVITGIEKVAAANDPSLQSFKDATTKPPPGTPPGGSMDTMKPTQQSNATGLDPDGYPSSVSFGLRVDSGIDNSDPSYMVATVYPEEGQGSADVLRALADAFNSQFASMGYTISYDSATALLKTNQIIPWGIGFVTGNTDTGLDFGFDMLADKSSWF